MRKLLFILMLAVSFALGLASQNLIAGNWVFPSIGTPAVNLTPHYSTFLFPDGKNYYLPPSGWIVESASPTSAGVSITVRLKKLE